MLRPECLAEGLNLLTTYSDAFHVQRVSAAQHERRVPQPVIAFDTKWSHVGICLLDAAINCAFNPFDLLLSG